MNKIKFSHRYNKLEGINRGDIAKLIAVSPITISLDTPKELIAYDTLYVDEKGNEGEYQLKKGSYVLLLFLCKNKLFTTIRPLIGYKGYNKLEYYSKKIFEDFYVEIQEVYQ